MPQKQQKTLSKDGTVVRRTVPKIEMATKKSMSRDVVHGGMHRTERGKQQSIKAAHTPPVSLTDTAVSISLTVYATPKEHNKLYLLNSHEILHNERQKSACE